MATNESKLDAIEMVTFIPAKDLPERYGEVKARPPKQEAWGRVIYLWGPAGELWHLTQRA